MQYISNYFQCDLNLKIDNMHLTINAFYYIGPHSRHMTG